MFGLSSDRGAEAIIGAKRVADYVDRILRGEKAGDLPVQQPTEYELIINSNAARALGLDDRGRLAPGCRADLAIWNIRHLPELCYWIGGGLLREVRIAGERPEAT